MRGFIVPAVHFRSHDRKVALRRFQRIGFEREINRGHSNRGFELRARLKALKPVLSRGVFVIYRLIGQLEDEFEIKECRNRFSIHCRPARLVDDGQVHHLEGRRFAIRTESKSA